MSPHEQIKSAFNGKTIKSAQMIKVEFGRTMDNYICFVFTDGSRFMISGGIPYSPNPDIEEMKKAPDYFSAQEISQKVLSDENKRRERIENDLKQKRYELDRLKKELGES